MIAKETIGNQDDRVHEHQLWIKSIPLNRWMKHLNVSYRWRWRRSNSYAVRVDTSSSVMDGGGDKVIFLGSDES